MRDIAHNPNELGRICITCGGGVVLGKKNALKKTRYKRGKNAVADRSKKRAQRVSKKSVKLRKKRVKSA